VNPMTRTALGDALAAGAAMPFHEAARLLLNCLGYRSDRTIEGQTGHVGDLPEAFRVNERTTQSAQAFKDEALSAHVIFQVGGEEIRDSAQARLLEDAGWFDAEFTKSFLFVAVELRGTGNGYSRTRLSQFAREANQGLAMPAFVLFRETDTGHLALAFVDRRPHKRADGRAVLSRVSLIRGIDPSAPHRAHLDILADLSLKLNQRLAWMESRGKSRNFDGLRAAVLDALDTAALNKRFYKELFAWFERAVEEATFPADPNRTVEPEHHVIRLITRLMFIWFIKEKNLVAAELFVEDKVAPLLRDYDPAEGDSWYRAVLQNLFFATLNTELDRRRFSSRSPRTHRVPGLYRYRDLMADPDRLVDLFEKTPFINGGLFECLDSDGRSQTTGGWRIDCFTDWPDHRAKLSVPNRLFFDHEGLIPLFERYRFTVEENTPIEKEVALDPEPLGSVFENLLAAVNPETKETARKESGSFYTPRPIVDYMIGEALALVLADAASPDDGDPKWWRERLLYSLDAAAAFDDARELFTPTEQERIVRAVADLTVLDPAVGSGAFLISALHTLTLLLRRLDPQNELWEAVQRRRAADRAKETFLAQRDDVARKDELEGVDETFRTYRGSDFGRKLYLIQNCLYGVDIQPVACLIAKLRFFISLAIEQETSQDPASNYGVRPLPNLETRIIAADTLIGVPGQAAIRTSVQEQIEADLRANRERHFHATTWPGKQDCRQRDEQLRQALSDELLHAGLSSTDARRVAEWDPYDQNASASWFDTEYMFGEHGFDVVVGNPPYRQLQKDGGALANKYQDAGFRSFVRTGDIYQLFIERGMDLLGGENSVLGYVTSNSWQKAKYGSKTRDLLGAHSPLRFINLGPGVFENAVVDTCVLIAKRGSHGETCRTAELRKGDKFPPRETAWANLRQITNGPWCVLSRAEWSLMEKIEAAGKPLGEWPGISIYRGLVTGLNKAFIVDNETKEALIREDPRSAELLKRVVRGRDVHAYRVEWSGLWLIATFPAAEVDIDDYAAIRRWLSSFGRRLHQTGEKLPGGVRARKKTQHAWWELQDSCAYYGEFEKPKLIWIELADRGRFALDRRRLFVEATAFMATSSSADDLTWLCAVLNSAVASWWVRTTAPTSGAGATRWKKVYVETLPLPTASPAAAARVATLVERAVRVCDAESQARLQVRIDREVATAYGLGRTELTLLKGT